MQSTIRYQYQAMSASGGSEDTLKTGCFKKKKMSLCVFGHYENTDDPSSPSLILVHERPTLLEQTNTALYLRLLETHRRQSACVACALEMSSFSCSCFPSSPQKLWRRGFCKVFVMENWIPSFPLQGTNSVFPIYGCVAVNTSNWMSCFCLGITK